MVIGDRGLAQELSPLAAGHRGRRERHLLRHLRERGCLVQLVDQLAALRAAPESASLILGSKNLGVALAKQRRFKEALAQFQETLRLDPTNSAAQKHVETIHAFLSRQNR